MSTFAGPSSPSPSFALNQTQQNLVRALTYSSSDWRDLLSLDPALQSGVVLDGLLVLLEAAAAHSYTSGEDAALAWQPQPLECGAPPSHIWPADFARMSWPPLSLRASALQRISDVLLTSLLSLRECCIVSAIHLAALCLPLSRRVGAALADIARGHRASSLGTAAALSLIIKYSPIEVHPLAVLPPDLELIESATRFLSSVRHCGAVRVVREAWDTCARFIMRVLAANGQPFLRREPLVLRMLHTPGTSLSYPLAPASAPAVVACLS